MPAACSRDTLGAMHDHYAALGVDPEADADAIRAAYRRLMRAHHPDRRRDDPASTEVALRLNAAWAVLRDPGSRAAYDRLRAPRRGPDALRSPADPGAARVQAPVRGAYSERQDAFRTALSAASLRAAALVLAIGVVLLLSTSAG